MPVQFVCSQCHRKLSVAQRKAGATVACPKCGQPNFVPECSADCASEPATAAGFPASAGLPGEAGPRVASGPAPAQSDWLPPAVTVEAAAFDDILHLISDQETAGRRPALDGPTPLAVSPATPSFDAATAPASAGRPVPPPIPPVTAYESPLRTAPPAATRTSAMRQGRHDHGTVLLITRRAVYALAALVGGMLLLAFVAGFIIGHSGRVEGKTAAEPAVAGEPVALDGYVLYSLSPGESLPDAGATVMALPVGKTAEQKIAARGLRPGDQDDLSSAPAAEALRSLGAAVARTDSSGQFQLVVPHPGDYSLVILSHRANRPEGQTIAMSDQAELSHVFASPKDLIGLKRYRIASRRLAGAPPAFTHEFGSIDNK